jgi:hypothetical protein
MKYKKEQQSKITMMKKSVKRGNNSEEWNGRVREFVFYLIKS